MRVVLFGLVAGIAVSGVARAADVKGSKDHPMVGRYEGSEIVGYKVTDYDQVRVVQAPFDPVTAEARTGPAFLAVEGRSFLIYYRLPEGRSSLEVLRNYETSLGGKGFTTVFECATSDGTCFGKGEPDAAYFLGTAIGPALSLPKLDGDYVHNWFGQEGRYLLARQDAENGLVYASISIGESPNGTVAVVRVVEPKAMDTDKIVFLDAGQMATAIGRSGRVTLDGIRFDFDKDTLKPESKPNSGRSRETPEDQAGSAAGGGRAYRQCRHGRAQPRSVGAARRQGRGHADVDLQGRSGAAVLRRGRLGRACGGQYQRGRPGAEPTGGTGGPMNQPRA